MIVRKLLINISDVKTKAKLILQMAASQAVVIDKFVAMETVHVEDVLIYGFSPVLYTLKCKFF